MTSKFSTQNEQRDIPSQILKTILDCMPLYVWFPSDVYIVLIQNCSGQLVELYHSTRVDLYCH